MSGQNAQGQYYTDEDGPRHVSMRAFCGQNYMVLASAAPDDKGTVFSHFRYSATTGQWQGLVLSGGECPGNGLIPFDLNKDLPDRVYIGKNFVVEVCTQSTIAYNGQPAGKPNWSMIRVYRRDAAGGIDAPLDCVDSIVVGQSYTGGIGNIVVGNNYYAYTVYGNTGTPDQMAIRVWNGTGFSQVNTSLGSIFNTQEAPFYISLTSMGNRLLVNWTTDYPNPIVWYLGSTTYSPSDMSWSAGQIIHSENVPSLNSGCLSVVGMALNQTTFVETPVSTVTGAVDNLFLEHAYHFNGNAVTCQTVDSVETKHAMSADWIWQAGGNFLAVAFVDSQFYGIPDSIRMYTMNDLTSGGMQFQGSPVGTTVSQKTYASGMGDQETFGYNFNSGVMNQYFT
ncbi:MAG: hypothetical protein M1339_02910, partial [Bacteroidetes bacterium]|nr:hypothetical protein [Bacteroidota bacterium]